MRLTILLLVLVLSGCTFTAGPKQTDVITPIRHRALTARIVEKAEVEVCILRGDTVFTEKKEIFGLLVLSPDLVGASHDKLTIGPTTGRRIAFIEADGVAMRVVHSKLVKAVETTADGQEILRQIDIGGLYLRATKVDAEAVETLVKRAKKEK